MAPAVEPKRVGEVRAQEPMQRLDQSATVRKQVLTIPGLRSGAGRQPGVGRAAARNALAHGPRLQVSYWVVKERIAGLARDHLPNKSDRRGGPGGPNGIFAFPTQKSA
jgi:hypothetical protein